MCLIVLGTTTHLFVSVWSSWGTVSTSLWVLVFNHPSVNLPPLSCECSIILEATIYLFVTVSYFWRPLSTSLWAFFSAWGPLSIFAWVFCHLILVSPIRDCSVIHGSTIHLFVSVLRFWGRLPTSTWLHRIIIMGATADLFLIARERERERGFYHPVGNNKPLTDCSVIM